MKIIIAGEDRESSTYIRDSLVESGLDIQLINFDILKKKNLRTNPQNLLILNFSNLNLLSREEIKGVVQAAKNYTPSIVTFIKQNGPQLLYSLKEEGLENIAELPFSPSEIQMFLSRFLQDSPGQKPAKGSGVTTGEKELILNDFFYMMESLRHYNWYFGEVIREILEFSHRALHIPHVLLLEDLGDTQGLVKDAISSSWIKNDLKINFEDFIEADRPVNEAIMVENLDNEHPVHIFGKSVLGLAIKSYILCPVILHQTRKFLFLFLEDNQENFSDTQKRYIFYLQKLAEFSLEKEKIYPMLRMEPGNVQAIFFQGIMDHLNFGIIIINRKLAIKFINREAVNLLNLQSDTRKYENIQDILGEQNTRAVVDSMQIMNGAFQRPEIELLTPNGQKVLIGFTLTEYVDTLSGEKGYILSLKDITYTKELQEEMSRMDRLASLGVMASGIAHEIRNPLAGIKAIAQTFEEELSKTDPKNEYVQRIIKQVNRLDDLLKSLFSYAKPQKPNRQFYFIQEIVQDVLSLLKQKLQSQNIKLSQSFEKNLPHIFVDNSQIQQVLFNLLLNGIEAIDESGEIKIIVKKVKPHDENFKRKPFYKKITENPYIHIRISDNGSGISHENLQQIFNPFFTTKNFGTGLGLSIVYQIVQENYGVIYFESELNVGTDCYLFLPAFEPIPKDSIKN